MTKQQINIQISIIEPDVIEYITIDGDIKVSPINEASDIIETQYSDNDETYPDPDNNPYWFYNTHPDLHGF